MTGYSSTHSVLRWPRPRARCMVGNGAHCGAGVRCWHYRLKHNLQSYWHLIAVSEGFRAYFLNRNPKRRQCIFTKASLTPTFRLLCKWDLTIWLLTEVFSFCLWCVSVLCVSLSFVVKRRVSDHYSRYGADRGTAIPPFPYTPLAICILISFYFFKNTTTARRRCSHTWPVFFHLLPPRLHTQHMAERLWLLTSIPLILSVCQLLTVINA